jgi:hypothetical protein
MGGASKIVASSSVLIGLVVANNLAEMATPFSLDHCTSLISAIAMS